MNKNPDTKNNPSAKTSAHLTRIIPDVLTLLNLLSGLIATILVIKGNMATSGLFFIISLVMDFADGLLARSLKTQSEMGKQLDSLADLVSFGIYPAIAMFLTLEKVYASFELYSLESSLLPFLALLLPVAGALRLARFNISSSSDDFFGLPIPASAIGIITLVIITNTLCTCNAWFTFFHSPFVHITAVLVYSLLMISTLPLMSFKIKEFKWKGNQNRIIFAAIVAAGVIVFKIPFLAFIIPLYIIFSLFRPQNLNTLNQA